jgi:hypothetical protein
MKTEREKLMVMTKDNTDDRTENEDTIIWEDKTTLRMWGGRRLEEKDVKRRKKKLEKRH